MIPATSPTALTSTYDRWTISSISQGGDGLADVGKSDVRPIRLTVTLTKFRVREDGVPERSPLASDVVTITLNDLYARVAANPVVSAAMSAFVTAVLSEAQAQSIHV